MPDFKVRHTHTPYTQRVKRGLMLLNTLASGWFWRFSQKKQQFSVALPTL